MKELVIDASKWSTSDDLYLSFFAVVKAPAWHGKNFNALRDSIAAGYINEIEVPYRLILKNYSQMPFHMEEITGHFIDLINELRLEGVLIEIRTEN